MLGGRDIGDVKKAVGFVMENSDDFEKLLKLVRELPDDALGFIGRLPDLMKTIGTGLAEAGEQAEKAARATQLPSVGVDFLVSAMPQKTITTEDQHPVIVEVNKCPALFLHETPTHGKPRPVIAAYLDYLADI